MTAHEHHDCLQCRENMQIINHRQTLILQKALQAMERTQERVIVHAHLRGKTVELLTIPMRLLLEALPTDENIKAAYNKILKELKTGETIVIVRSDTDHMGVYKIPAGPMN